MRGAGLEARWVVSWRYVDTDVDRARWRGTANVRVLPVLQLGVEVNPAAEEFGPLATLFVVNETHARPAVFVGTSSDRIGSPKGTQSYYVTVAKHAPGLPVSGYVTLNYSEWDEGLNVPFGGNLRLRGGFSLQPMFDGDRTHLLLNYEVPHATISLMWVWLEEPGVSLSFGF